MSKTRIWLLGNYPPDRQESMLRYAELLMDLFEGDAGIHLRFWQPTPVLGKFLKGGMAGKYAGYLDKFVVFPRRMRRLLATLPVGERPDAIHIADHSNAPWLSWFTTIPTLITCHDLFAIELARGRFAPYRTAWAGRRLQDYIAASLKDARRVVAVSGYTARRFAEVFPQADPVAGIIPSALNQSFPMTTADDAVRMRRKWGLSDESRVLFNLGNNSWYKNRMGLLEIFREVVRQYPQAPAFTPTLVVAGTGSTTGQRQWIRNNLPPESVRFVGKLSTAELATAYRMADVFVFPSLYEGFGWPPLEAQHCGVPVVAGNGGALGEVLADSAILVDPHDARSFAAAVCRLLNNPGERRGWMDKGVENVARFSRERMGLAYRNLYLREFGNGGER